jgi:hypothetical protein
LRGLRRVATFQNVMFAAVRALTYLPERPV